MNEWMNEWMTSQLNNSVFLSWFTVCCVMSTCTLNEYKWMNEWMSVWWHNDCDKTPFYNANTTALLYAIVHHYVFSTDCHSEFENTEDDVLSGVYGRTAQKLKCNMKGQDHRMCTAAQIYETLSIPFRYKSI